MLCSSEVARLEDDGQLDRSVVTDDGVGVRLACKYDGRTRVQCGKAVRTSLLRLVRTNVYRGTGVMLAGRLK